MNDLIKDKILMFFGAFIRYGIVAVVGWLVSHKIVTEGEAAALTDPALIIAMAGALLTFVVALYIRIKSRYKTNVALKLPAGATTKNVENVVSNSTFKEIISAKAPQNVTQRMNQDPK